MSKYFAPSALGAVLALSTLLACGVGPESGSPLGPTPEEQRIAVIAGQRVPPTDPQAVGTVDPQALPAGGGVNIPPGEAGCEQFCAPFREAECGIEDCESMCAALRAVPGACAEALLQLAQCFIRGTERCGEVRSECVANSQNLQTACAGYIENFGGMSVTVEEQR